MDLQNVGWRHGLDWSGSGQGQVTGTYECGNESSEFIKCGNFLTSGGPVSFSRRTLLTGYIYIFFFLCALSVIGDDIPSKIGNHGPLQQAPTQLRKVPALSLWGGRPNLELQTCYWFDSDNNPLRQDGQQTYQTAKSVVVSNNGAASWQW